MTKLKLFKDFLLWILAFGIWSIIIMVLIAAQGGY